MRNKLILLLIALIFVILILSAMVLYDRLGSDMVPNLMAGEPAAPEAGTAAPSDRAEPADKETPSDETSADTAAKPETVPAPDFTVTDAGGNEVRLSDFIGTPVVLNFWASWCGPCKLEMPDFEQAYQAYGEEVAFMLVNLTDGYQETVTTASDFLATKDYTFPVYFDVSFEAAATYAVSSVPVTYFIDETGAITAMGRGMLTLESIEKGISMILPQS